MIHIYKISYKKQSSPVPENPVRESFFIQLIRPQRLQQGNYSPKIAFKSASGVLIGAI